MRAGLREWVLPGRPDPSQLVTDPAQRRMVVVEIVLVLAITIGLSAARSLLSLLDSLLAARPLSEQAVAINAPAARADLIDLFAQLVGIAQLLAWGGLGAYLLVRAGMRLRDIGLDRRRPGRDILVGVGLAALIGIPGLGLYLGAYALGLSVTVVPSALDEAWWRVPVLVAAAFANAWAEELLVVGYLLTRLRHLGVGSNAALLASAVLRGAYHLYQGFGGFVGNLIMGVIFGRVWQRTGRLWPLVAAHTLIDVVAFVGYALLAGRAGWLPGGG